jgi:phenylpyruvate tautomerase PptA (4-oxalocrotonate tautomerase family)
MPNRASDIMSASPRGAPMRCALVRTIGRDRLTTSHVHSPRFRSREWRNVGQSLTRKTHQMPLWHIYCPENAYSAEDKCALATRITDLYADVGLPRFYVSVVFHELSKNSFFVGGKATNDVVRIWIDQIARATAPELRAWWLERVNTTLSPFARERGYRQAESCYEGDSRLSSRRLAARGG